MAREVLSMAAEWQLALPLSSTWWSYVGHEDFSSVPELSGGDDVVRLICSWIRTPYLFRFGWPTSCVAHFTASQDGHEFNSGT